MTPFNTLQEFQAYKRKKAREYYQRHKDDPEFKNKKRSITEKWEKENSEKVKKNKLNWWHRNKFVPKLKRPS